MIRNENDNLQQIGHLTDQIDQLNLQAQNRIEATRMEQQQIVLANQNQPMLAGNVDLGGLLIEMCSKINQNAEDVQRLTQQNNQQADQIKEGREAIGKLTQQNNQQADQIKEGREAIGKLTQQNNQQFSLFQQQNKLKDEEQQLNEGKFSNAAKGAVVGLSVAVSTGVAIGVTGGLATGVVGLLGVKGAISSIPAVTAVAGFTGLWGTAIPATTIGAVKGYKHNNSLIDEKVRKQNELNQELIDLNTQQSIPVTSSFVQREQARRINNNNQANTI